MAPSRRFSVFGSRSENHLNDRDVQKLAQRTCQYISIRSDLLLISSGTDYCELSFVPGDCQRQCTRSRPLSPDDVHTLDTINKSIIPHTASDAPTWLTPRELSSQNQIIHDTIHGFRLHFRINGASPSLSQTVFPMLSSLIQQGHVIIQARGILLADRSTRLSHHPLCRHLSARLAQFFGPYQYQAVLYGSNADPATLVTLRDIAIFVSSEAESNTALIDGADAFLRSFLREHNITIPTYRQPCDGPDLSITRERCDLVVPRSFAVAVLADERMTYATADPALRRWTGSEEAFEDFRDMLGSISYYCHTLSGDRWITRSIKRVVEESLRGRTHRSDRDQSDISYRDFGH